MQAWQSLMSQSLVAQSLVREVGARRFARQVLAREAWRVDTLRAKCGVKLSQEEMACQETPPKLLHKLPGFLL